LYSLHRSGNPSPKVRAHVGAQSVLADGQKERVSKTMKALDYHPDHLAGSLKVGRTQVIVMVVPDLTNALVQEVIQGVEDAARLEE
jgi:DNA-binding LacI/PurR family transcriptional regulator